MGRQNLDHSTVLVINGSTNFVLFCLVGCHLSNVENHWFTAYFSTSTSLTNSFYPPDLLSFRAGVSSTRPAGHMWHTRCICAAREHLKKLTILLILNKVSLFKEQFVARLSFFLFKLRPGENFFFGMWPSNQFEFETPVLGYLTVSFFFSKFCL